ALMAWSLTTTSALAFVFEPAACSRCLHSSSRRSPIRSVQPITKLLITSRRSPLLGAASHRCSTSSACTNRVSVSRSHVAKSASDGRPQKTRALLPRRPSRQPSQLQNRATAPSKCHLIRWGSSAPGRLAPQDSLFLFRKIQFVFSDGVRGHHGLRP